MWCPLQCGLQRTIKKKKKKKKKKNKKSDRNRKVTEIKVGKQSEWIVTDC